MTSWAGRASQSVPSLHASTAGPDNIVPSLQEAESRARDAAEQMQQARARAEAAEQQLAQETEQRGIMERRAAELEATIRMLAADKADQESKVSFFAHCLNRLILQSAPYK